jgi:translin
MATPRRDALGDLVAGAISDLAAAHSAREAALASCRRVIRAAGLSIRAVHRLEMESAAGLIADAEAELRSAQAVLAPYPAIAHAGFLHDAEKEFVEAVATVSLVGGETPQGPDQLRVGVPAWLNGLAEAASELRRHLLDRLREGSLERAEELLGAMDDVYDLLRTVDFPDAITGGLRRTADALRAVLERSRADVTTTVLQTRLQRAIEAERAAMLGPEGT